MNMFDKDNELSMLIIKQLAKEDKWNALFWRHIAYNIAKGTYQNFSMAIFCTCRIAGYNYD